MCSSGPPTDQPADFGAAARAQLSAIAAERDRRQRLPDAQGASDTAEPAPSAAESQAPPEKGAVPPADTETDEERQEYIRLIRDGHADRVEHMVRVVSREIEVGRKSDRFSDTAGRLADQFEEAGKRFIRKKEILIRVEERLGPLRKMVAEQPQVEEIREQLGHDRPTAEKMVRLLRETAILRDDLIDLAVHLLDLRDRIDEQVRADEKEQEYLRAQINQFLESSSSKERLEFEVRLERSLRGVRLQQRLDVLRKHERILAEASPEGRRRRMEDLLTGARTQLDAGDFQQAITLLEEAYALDQMDETVVLELANVHAEHGQPERAIAMLNNLLQGGESIPALLALARCFEKSAQVERALDAYARAVALRPQDFHVQAIRCEALARFGWVDEARQELSKLHARHPDSLEIALVFGCVCVLVGDLRRAREVLARVTRDRPDWVKAWEKLADLHWQAHELDDAEQAYRRVIELEDGHFEALIRLADLERQRGNYQAAAELYEAAKDLDDNSWPVQFGLGIVLRETDRPADAVTVLERAVALNPKDGETHHHLGLAWLLAGDPTRAAQAIQHAISLGFTNR